ncbi:MAG: DNA-directed RNA polymerase subunit omega [Nitrospirae bacterium]|nr:MAG: DNA-directed RNA polymerase subunit omega [Nitrospirota bacterium]
MVDALSLLPEGHEQQFDSRYRIVIIAAQRARQLMQGAQLSGPTKFKKETSQALQEVLEGRVPFLVGDEAKQAMKEARRVVEREVDAAALARHQEVASELQKDLSVYIDDTPRIEERSEAEE